YRIARRTAVTPAPVELPILALLEHGAELLEVDRSRTALDPEQLGQVVDGFRAVAKVGKHLQHAIRHVAVAHEHNALIVYLRTDDLPREPEPNAGQIEEAVLPASRVHAACRQAAQHTKKTSGWTEVRNVYSQLYTRRSSLRGDLYCAIAVDRAHLLAGNFARLFAFHDDHQLIAPLSHLRPGLLHYQHLAFVTARSRWLQCWRFFQARLGREIQCF